VFSGLCKVILLQQGRLHDKDGVALRRSWVSVTFKFTVAASMLVTSCQMVGTQALLNTASIDAVTSLAVRSLA
jgi:hypothetical protein